MIIPRINRRETVIYDYLDYYLWPRPTQLKSKLQLLVFAPSHIFLAWERLREWRLDYSAKMVHD